MAEKAIDDINVETKSPSHSLAANSGGGGGRESLDSTTSTGSSASPKLSISSRIQLFGRSRSNSQQNKEDSDEQQETSLSHSESDREKEKGKKEKGWQFFAPKAKPSTGWIPLPFSFTMSHREKNDEIHKIFSQLPSQEKLIDDYSCALQRDILIHGRLYLTQNWLCFYANIFSWETLLTIPLRTVTSITKERTALLIPNAILITTTVEKYGFTSLIQRDITYNVIFKVWQNSLLDQPLLPIELVKAARKAWGDSTDVGTVEELWGPNDNKVTTTTSASSLPRQHSMPTHLEIGQVPATTTREMITPVPTSKYVTSKTSSRQKKEASSLTIPRADVEALKKTSSTATTMATATTTDTVPSLNTTISPSHPRQGHIPASTMSETSTETGSTEIAQNTQNVASTEEVQPKVEQKKLGEDMADKISRTDSRNSRSSGEFEAFSFPDDQGEVSCGCTEHVGRTIINEVYNAEVETIFQLIFTDSDFIRSFLKSRKTTNIEIGDWLTQPDGTRLRDFTYTLFLNYSFGPKYSPCVERQIYYKNGQPGVKHVVKSEVINSNVPYGDTFYVSCLSCMTRVAHNRTRLRVTSNICFKKNCWGVVKNLIERNAGDGLRSYYNHLDTALKEYLVTLPAKRLQKNSRRSSRRRHRRQPSLTKLTPVPSTRGNYDEDSAASLKKRRGSMSSRQSLRLSDQKVSEEDAQSSSSGERRNQSRSIPKVNVALIILLGLLIISNLALYHQLMGYQAPPSSSIPPPKSYPSSPPQYSQAFPTLPPPSSIRNWPTKQEEWINLIQRYWEQQDMERQNLQKILKDILDAMQQVEMTIHKTRKQLETHLQLNNFTSSSE